MEAKSSHALSQHSHTPQRRFGGSIKVCKILNTLAWPTVKSLMVKASALSVRGPGFEPHLMYTSDLENWHSHGLLLMLVGCFTSHQHASISQE